MLLAFPEDTRHRLCKRVESSELNVEGEYYNLLVATASHTVGIVFGDNLPVVSLDVTVHTYSLENIRSKLLSK